MIKNIVPYMWLAVRSTFVIKPGIERVEALADISRSALCCHSNETRAPIADSPNSAQLEGTPAILPTYIWVRTVVWECGEGQTDTQTAVSNIYFASATPHAKCNNVTKTEVHLKHRYNTQVHNVGCHKRTW